MLIKEAIQERCPKCNSHIKQISPEVYGCDECKKEIDIYNDKYNNRASSYLDITIFYESGSGEDTTHHQFCSWKCCYKFLAKLKDRKDIYFVSLPELSWERDIKDKYVGDFFDCIKKENL